MTERPAFDNDIRPAITHARLSDSDHGSGHLLRRHLFSMSAPADVAFQTHQGFDELRIARGLLDPEYPSPSRLPESMAIQAKADNIPSNFSADVMYFALTGDTFPSMRINAAVKRCRAELQITYFWRHCDQCVPEPPTVPFRPHPLYDGKGDDYRARQI